MDNPESLMSHPQRYRFISCPQKGLNIPIFGGSMIRGAIGHALLDQCRCGLGNHRSDCLYKGLFETAAGNSFVVTPPRPQELINEEPFTFQLTLLKPTIERKRALFDAIERALNMGLTSERIRCRLLSIESDEPSRERLGKVAFMHLLSPWFIKRGGKAVSSAQCTAHTLLIGMAQRQRMLCEQGLLDIEVPSNIELLRIADELTCRLQLHDCRGERRSSRQKSKHPLSGFMGTATLIAPRGGSLAALEPLLRMAERVHGGGKVSFGLGALAVQGQTELSSLFV